MDASTAKVRKMKSFTEVDDEPGILELLKVYLEAEDAHEVVTATSGAEALVIDKADADFECLLVDIQMPLMNGIALVEHVRSMPDYVHVPVIMLTAMSQRSYIDKAFTVGATDYITKPFDRFRTGCATSRCNDATIAAEEWSWTKPRSWSKRVPAIASSR